MSTKLISIIVAVVLLLAAGGFVLLRDIPNEAPDQKVEAAGNNSSYPDEDRIKAFLVKHIDGDNVDIISPKELTISYGVAESDASKILIEDMEIVPDERDNWYYITANVIALESFTAINWGASLNSEKIARGRYVEKGTQFTISALISVDPDTGTMNTWYH